MREMRTIPAILAATAIAVAPVVLSAPQAHAGDKCDQFSGNPSAYNMCESQQARLNQPPPQQQVPDYHPCYSTGYDDQGNECNYVDPHAPPPVYPYQLPPG